MIRTVLGFILAIIIGLLFAIIIFMAAFDKSRKKPGKYVLLIFGIISAIALPLLIINGIKKIDLTRQMNVAEYEAYLYKEYSSSWGPKLPNLEAKTICDTPLLAQPSKKSHLLFRLPKGTRLILLTNNNSSVKNKSLYISKNGWYKVRYDYVKKNRNKNPVLDRYKSQYGWVRGYNIKPYNSAVPEMSELWNFYRDIFGDSKKAIWFSKMLYGYVPIVFTIFITLEFFGVRSRKGITYTTKESLNYEYKNFLITFFLAVSITTIYLLLIRLVIKDFIINSPAGNITMLTAFGGLFFFIQTPIKWARLKYKPPFYQPVSDMNSSKVWASVKIIGICIPWIANKAINVKVLPNLIDDFLRLFNIESMVLGFILLIYSLISGFFDFFWNRHVS